MKHLYFAVNLFFVFTVAFAVIDGIDHKECADHQSRDDTCKEQITDRGTGSHTIHDKRNTRWNDNTETAGYSYDRSRKRKVISQSCKNRDRHTSDCGNSCRSRTGDRTIKKTGDDNGTRHTCGEFSEEVCKNIKQFFGNTTFCHDDTGKDKHRNRKERERVQTAEHGTDQIFGTDSKGRIKHGRKNSCNPESDGYRNCDDL